MKLVLIGIQGSGKSTQGHLLAEKYGVPYLASGQVFRDMSKSQSDLGKQLRELLNAGHLVPDDMTIKIIREYLTKPEFVNGYVLDGAIRTVTQAEAFDSEIDKAIFINVSDEEALKRLSTRVSDREDETPEAIKKRISLFHEKTKPVLEFFRSHDKLIEVNGEQTVEQVFEEALQKLN